MDNNVVDRRSVVVAPLNHARARIPDLDSTIFGASDHPFPIAMKRDASDVVRMALKDRNRRGVSGANVE